MSRKFKITSQISILVLYIFYLGIYNTHWPQTKLNSPSIFYVGNFIICFLISIKLDYGCTPTQFLLFLPFPHKKKPYVLANTMLLVMLVKNRSRVKFRIYNAIVVFFLAYIFCGNIHIHVAAYFQPWKREGWYKKGYTYCEFSHFFLRTD